MTTLLVLLLIPFAGGLLAWAAGRARPDLARWTALAATAAGLVFSVIVWIQSAHVHQLGADLWMAQVNWAWIPQLGIRFHLAMDGLSLLMIVLTYFLGVAGVLASWTGITERVPFFHFNLLWVLAGVVGVFLALDLFLFYFFWELMLVPMYFLIGIWGHENRTYAAIKFFIFTQAGGLLMLLSILGLAFAHRAATGTLTFDYMELVGTPLGPVSGMLLMLGFFIAFAIKLPAFPLHTWLPDAHTEAPTAGSLILAGLLLKTGAYGMLRFAVPLFPDAAARFAPVAMAIGAAGILYGAVLAFAQTDLKRMVAYTSVSHLGFVLLGVFAWNPIALEGVVMQMIAHGLSTGGLFVLVGFLYERLHTRDMSRMGDLWSVVPRMGGFAMFLAMASLGLPGLANFVAEFLVLLGSYRANAAITIVATVGLVLATIYSLWLMQKVFHGRPAETWKVPDLRLREAAVLLALVVVLVWLGFFPRPVLDTARPALDGLHQLASVVTLTGGR